MKHNGKIYWVNGCFLLCLWGLVACGGKAEPSATAVPPTSNALATVAPTTVAASPIAKTATLVPTSDATAQPTAVSPTLAPTQEPTAEQPTAEPTTAFVPTEEASLPEDPGELELVNQIGGLVRTVTVANNIAFVGVGPRLVAIDVSDPAQPQWLSQSAILPGLVKKIIVADKIAYLAVSGSGLWLFDVSDPQALRPLGHTSTAADAANLWLDGTIVYVIDGLGATLPGSVPSFLSVVDVSDSAAPVEIATLILPDVASDLVLNGTTLYIKIYNNYVDGQKSLVAVDVSDPASPKISQTVADLDGARLQLVGGDLVGSLPGGYVVLNVADSPQPQEMAQQADLFNPLLPVDKFAIANGKAYFLNNGGDAGYFSSSLAVYDVADLSQPQALDEANVGYFSPDLFVDKDLAYVAIGTGLSIYGVVDNAVTLLGSWDSVGPVNQVAFGGDELFTLANRDRLITMFDLSDMTHPEANGRYTATNAVNDIAADDQHLYLGTSYGALQQIDIADPTNPEVMPPFFPNIAENVNGTVVEPPYLYTLLDGNLSMADLSDPSQPVEMPQMSYDYLYQLQVEGEMAFGLTDNAILMYDMNTPTAVTPFNPISADGAPVCFFAVQENYLYMGITHDVNCWNPGVLVTELWVMDISDPANPQKVNSVALSVPSGTATAVEGRIYLATGDIQTLDISDPAQPVMLTGNGFAPSATLTAGQTHQLIVHEGLLYAADEAGGLLIYEIH